MSTDIGKIPSYGKILTLGSLMTENALKGEVVIQEKLDGSQFGFGVSHTGDIVMRSKSVQLYRENYAEMFDAAVQFVLTNEAKVKGHIKPNTYLFCEFLSKPKHNTLKYEKIPQNHLCVFDILMDNQWLPRYEVKTIAGALGIDIVPEIYRGDATTDTVKDLLKTESYLGGEIVEGVVIKNYHEHIMIRGMAMPLFTKYVREEFKERHDADWKVRSPKGALQEFIEGFKSEARWQKAIVHAKEKGILEQSPRDIGVLLKMVKEDIVEEEAEHIKKHLYKCFIDDILRHSTRGFPEWYKDKLLENVK